MYILLSIAMIIIGLIMLIKPEAYFTLTESWKSNSRGEPSDLYVFNTRLGGGLLVVAGIICIIVSIVS